MSALPGWLTAALSIGDSVGARVLHVDDAVGSVAASKLADRIAVEGEPTREIGRCAGFAW
jgi:imidazolonepropionase-like amidohydrolase